MHNLPQKYTNRELAKFDKKHQYLDSIIENTITNQCEKLYEEVQTYCENDCAKAFNICDEIIKLNPNFVKAHLKKIWCKRRTDYSIMISEGLQLLNKYPDTPQILEAIGITYCKAKNYREAAHYLSACLKHPKTNHFDSYYHLAYSFRAIGDSKNAITNYTKEIELKDSARAYCNRGLIYEELDKLEDALNDIKKSVVLKEQNETEEEIKKTKNILNRIQKKIENQLPF